MTKQEVLNRLEELLKLEDMEQAIAEVDAVETEYQKITEQEHQQAQKLEVAEHTPEVAETEGTEAQPELGDDAASVEPTEVAKTTEEAAQAEVVSPTAEDKELDKKIKALLQGFNTRKEQYEARKEQDEHTNLKDKQQVLEDLKNLIKDGPTITQAYDAFNHLKERWKNIGPVPRKNYKQLQSEYSHQIDMFFHTMQIFRDLKVYDLDKNYEAKKALIAKAKELESETSINKVDDMLKVYQTEWAEMGPVKEEHWKEIRTDFWAGVNAAYDRIQAHYDSIRDRQKVALEAKEALGKIIVDILDQDLSSHKKWQEATEKVLQAQKDWNTTGNLAKKENDRVYKEFRAACNVFFHRKKEFYGTQKEQSKAGNEAKMALIAKAESLKDQTEWKNTTEALIRLQNEWKSTPSAGNKEDQRLWTRFRATCDYFFEAKKQYYATLDDRQAVNLKAKQEFIAKVEAFELSGNKDQDLTQLKEFNEEWRTLGPVPKNDIDTINNSYKAALDAQYDKLKMSKTEKTLTQFKNKVDSLSSGEGGGRMIEQERREVQEQIKKLKETIDTYENNLGFFGNSKGSNALKEGVLKNIERTKEELAVWEAKLKQLPKPDQNAVREERPRFDSKPRFDRGGRGGNGGGRR